MTLNATLLLGFVTMAGATLGAGILVSAGAPLLAAGFGGLLSAGCAVALGQIIILRTENSALKEAFLILQADGIALTERQAQADATMAEMERRTIESPALVWRAATADIQVLSALLSDLAKTVTDHERRLLGQAVPVMPAVIEAEAVQPAAKPGNPSALVAATHAPDWYEDEAELGFTTDAVPQATLEAARTASSAPSPAIMAELKTTLASALASDRLELCLQPIVTLPQRKTRGYEATLRLKGESGDQHSDLDLRRLATATELEADLDRVLLERATQVLRILRARNRDVTMTCMISGGSLSVPFFQASAERLFRSDQGIASSITLEISDVDFKALSPQGRATMADLGGKGMGFGLTDLAHLQFDMAQISVAAIRQIRISAHMLLESAKGTGSKADIHPADLAEFLSRRNIELLVGDIDSEQIVIDLLDYAAPLALGPLFGAARAVRPEVLEPKPVDTTGRVSSRAAQIKAAQELAGVNEKPGATGRSQRQSFRSLLRRA